MRNWGLGLVCELMILLFEAPVEEIAGVQSDTEEIGGDEAELRRAESDHTDDGAVDSGYYPALPELSANEDRADDREHAGEIVETYDVQGV